MYHFAMLRLIAGLLLIALCGCGSDHGPANVAQPGPPTARTGAVTGVVADQDAQAVHNARVVVHNGDGSEIATTTDADGRFVLQGVQVGRRIVRLSRDGYVENQRLLTVVAERSVPIAMQMREYGTSNIVDLRLERTVTHGGGSVLLPPMAVKDPNGVLGYIVEVHFTAWERGDPAFAATTPGGFFASDDVRTGLVVGVSVLDIDVRNPDGDQVTLVGDVRATVTFPSPIGASSDAILPLWCLDRESGLWIRDGLAVRDPGGGYRAAVAQLGTWMLAKPADQATAAVRLSFGGERLHARTVRVAGASWEFFGVTSASGETRILVPAKERASVYQVVAPGMLNLLRADLEMPPGGGTLLELYDETSGVQR